jgi:hypothetical protein
MCSGFVVVLLNQPTKDVYDILYFLFSPTKLQKILSSAKRREKNLTFLINNSFWEAKKLV